MKIGPVLWTGPNIVKPQMNAEELGWKGFLCTLNFPSPLHGGQILLLRSRTTAAGAD